MKLHYQKLLNFIAIATIGHALVASASIAERCQYFMAVVKGSEQSVRYPLNLPNFKKSVSVFEIEQANLAAERYLKANKIAYREVKSDGVAPARLDSELPAGHPLKGKAKVYEIIATNGDGKASVNETALRHPAFDAMLGELNKKGTAVLIDTSVGFSIAEATTSPFGLEIHMTPSTNWSQFRHEKSHVDFYYDVLGEMNKRGYFTELRHTYQKMTAERERKYKDYEFIPFDPALTFDHPDLKFEQSMAFLKMAQDIHGEEYQQLLAERHPLGYVIKHLREGYHDIKTLNEGAATSLQMDLIKEQGIPNFSIAKLNVESYQNSFKIEELQARPELSAAQQKKLKSLLRREVMIRFLKEIALPSNSQEIRSLALKIGLMGVSGLGIAGISGAFEDEDKKKKEEPIPALPLPKRNKR